MLPVNVILLFLFACCEAQTTNQVWDIAVAVGNQIKLLSSSGFILGTVDKKLNNVRALAYDYVHHLFLVSNSKDEDDMILKVRVTSEKPDIINYMRNLDDHVEGMDIDLQTNRIFWTDENTQAIVYAPLDDPSPKRNVLITFVNDSPQDIAIDLCRRYIYLTNTNTDKPSIVRLSIDDKDEEILVSGDLFMPTGIAVDHETDKIFWIDLLPGIYFRVESAKTDGSERRVVYTGTYQRPFGIAVDSNFIYWTDTNGDVYRKNKSKEDMPQRIQSFKETPRGIAVRTISFGQRKECSDVQTLVENTIKLASE